jgi:hypothetical protein
MGGERKRHDEIENSVLSANLKIFLFPSMCPYFHLFHMLLYLTLHRTYGSLDCMEIGCPREGLTRSKTTVLKQRARVFGFTHDQSLR